MCFTSTYRPIGIPDLTKARSTEIEVSEPKYKGPSRAVELQKRSKIGICSKYRKGRTDAYPEISNKTNKPLPHSINGKYFC